MRGRIMQPVVAIEWADLRATGAAQVLQFCVCKLPLSASLACFDFFNASAISVCETIA
jgi:hypothetical protein